MIDFEHRLASLKNRRQGTTEIAALRESRQFSAEAYDYGSLALENFERLRESSGVKYAIGAMASVGDKYTATSINEGNRIANAVIAGLHKLGESVTCRMQGSVALDIHIKGFSDVDMLIICHNPVSTQKPYIYPDAYKSSNDNRSISQIILDIGSNAERIIKSEFHTSSVKRGSKSIAVEGGSLTRKVDIVPSIWHHSHEYQRTKAEHDRGIKICDSSDCSTIENYPFLHIKKIEDLDFVNTGNLKSVIRLVKNLVADMPESKQKIAKGLSSYDIASVCYHMHDLVAPNYLKLSLVEKLRLHFDYVAKNDYYRNNLMVPNKTRQIFDSQEKNLALNIIKDEVNDLAASIARDINPYNRQYTPSDILNKSVEFIF